MDKHVTILDIAREAGVSPATVSRTLNDTDYPVNAQIRQKVRETAERLGYVPNIVARSLRGKISRDIGVVIPNVSNPFYLQAIMGINDALANQNHSIILCDTVRDVKQERVCMRCLYERRVCGVILSSVEENAEMLRKYINKGMKIVLLDQMFTDMNCPGINFDSRIGSRMAVEYLLSQGHRKIAFGTMPLNLWTRNEMHKGYQDALLAAGIAYLPDFVYQFGRIDIGENEDLELQVGKRIAEAMIHNGLEVSAILCCNDMVAFGVIQTFLKQGIRVPEDISVIGFDDIPLAEAFLPSLTTVHYPAKEAGRLASLMIIDAQNTAKEMAISINLTPRLVVRDTVAPPRK